MAEVLVLGAGLAGSAAACLLARAGREVRLVERETGPHHKVCGEFLSVEAVAHLHELGVDLPALGAVPIERVRLISGRIEADAPLPFGAFGLSRHVLDEALLARAAAAGSIVERGVRVLELDGCVARTNRGDREGRHVLLATGKRPVREKGEEAPGRAEDGFVGFKMHYALAPQAMRRLAGTIRLVLFDGGYAGLQMVEGDRANLCLVVRRSLFQSLGGDWPALRDWLGGIAGLRDVLTDGEPLFERPLTIANLVYGSPPRRPPGGNVLRLGDRWAMTPSLTGDGMAIALRSAFLAARCLSAGEDAAVFHRRLAGETRGQMRRAMALHHALDRPALRQAGCALARTFPPLLTLAARATRLREWGG